MANKTICIDVPDIPGYTFVRYGVAEDGEWILLDTSINRPHECMKVKGNTFNYRRLIYSKNPEPVQISELMWNDIEDLHLLTDSSSTWQVIFTGQKKMFLEFWEISERMDNLTLKYVKAKFMSFAVIARID